MAENRPPLHQKDEVDTRALARFGIAFALGLVVILFMVFLVFNTFLGREAMKGPPPSQGLDVDAKKLPPEPRLQSAPVRDLIEMRAAEDQLLSSYAWLDRAHGLVRIPIDRAMDLVVREQPPARQSTVLPAATVPTESGLGGPLSDQPLEIHGNGSARDGRQAGGPPTPVDRSLGNAPARGSERLVPSRDREGAVIPAQEQTK